MRKRLVVGTIFVFALFAVWKVRPWLSAARPAVYATPTVQPSETTPLDPVKVPARSRACLDQIPLGPEARYLLFTPTARRSPGAALRITAAGAGYRSSAVLPASAPDDVAAIVRLDPAPHRIPNGEVCITNTGQHSASFYGVGEGRGSTTSTTLVRGRAVPQRLSLTVLSSPSQPLRERLGTVFSHMAAFRPVGTWFLWVLALLLVGVPAAVGFALTLADAHDAEGEHAETPPPRLRGGR